MSKKLRTLTIMSLSMLGTYYNANGMQDIQEPEDLDNDDSWTIIEQPPKPQPDQRNLSAQLCHSVENDDWESVETLLKRGADINTIIAAGQTPLHWAIKRGNKEATKLCLEHNANVNARACDGSTPLALAVDKDYAGTIKLLIKHYNANKEIADNEGRTPLHLAVLKNNDKAVKVLLKLGADTNLIGVNGKTIMQIAGELGHAKIYKQLSAANTTKHKRKAHKSWSR